jgi:uncharacterized protein (DUF983 family)
MYFDCWQKTTYCMGYRYGQGAFAMSLIKDPISLTKAMWRGFVGKCPNCGNGHLFGSFLKVVDQCDKCGEEFHHHRADDFPAYLVIIVVGHAIVPAILAVEAAYAPPVWLQLTVWLPLTLFSALFLLQPTKGAIVGLQWQTGMHGFDGPKQRRLAEEAPRLTAGAPTQRDHLRSSLLSESATLPRPHEQGAIAANHS